MVRPQSTIATTSATTAVPSVFTNVVLPEFFQTGTPTLDESLEDILEYHNAQYNESLPEFFQTENPTFEELVEDYAQNGGDDYYEYENEEDPQDGANNHLVQTPEDGIDDENITHELLDFFHGVTYDSMEEYFRSFEPGETWTSNPIFTDVFAYYSLPKALSDILVELHAVLQIHRVVPLDWDTNDARYSSLSVPQQTCLRELIHETPAQYDQLNNIHNRLKGYKCRTPYPQLKFVLIKTLDVVEDILRKEVCY
jgi:hypothetical protein